MLNVETLPAMWTDWRVRFNDREVRYAEIDRVVAGQFDVFDADEQTALNASPNFVQTALFDTAESASLIPTVRCTPWRNSDLQRDRSKAMERIGVAYMTAWGADLMIPETVLSLAKYGMCPWIIWPDFDQRIPLLELRDPRTCLPEPGYHAGDRVRRCMFNRQVFISQLIPEHIARINAWWSLNVPRNQQTRMSEITKVTLVEYFDTDEYVLAAMMSSQTGMGASATVTYTPVVLERIANRLDHVPVVIGTRVIDDDEFRGQFDQILDLQRAHVRLSSLSLDYADQSVYSDIWVKDPIGEVAFGGGSFIELGPNGAIGRVPPAVSSMNVQRDLQQLETGLHMGGRWPQSRPGEISQSIASAKFLESAAGLMNTAIRTYHLVLAHMFGQALQIGMELDMKLLPGVKTIAGVLRNQNFLEEYDTADIEPKNRMRAEYGIGLGRTASESAVLAIQYQQNGFISKQLVMESIEGITDLAREKARIESEQLEAILMAKLLQDTQSGALDDEALIKIIAERAEGKSITALYTEYVIKPKKDAMQSPLGGPGGMPALGPGAPMGPAPAAGPPGMPPSPAVPPPPAPAQITSRLLGGNRQASLMSQTG